MTPYFTREAVERWRDRTHRRTPRLAISTKSQALRFVNETGFCFAFAADDAELPSLWHAACGERDPARPLHTHHDPAISFVWEMKDVLPAEGKIYYGKLLRRRPTMTSLEFLSFFFALSGRKGAAREHRREFSRGSITRAANDIMEALGDSSPQTTKGLKLATGLHAPRSRTEFDKAIAELQQRMYIVKVAEEYTPFSFVWAPLITVFPDQVREAQRIKAHHARRTILAKYFEIQLVATIRELRRLFDWPAPDIGHPLADLVKHGTLYEAVKVEGSTGSYYCHKKG